MPSFLNPNQFRQINPLNNLPTLESQVIGGVERKVLSYLFPDKNGGARPKVGASVDDFDIDQFRANLNKHNETARQDKFNVMFGIPPGLSQYVGSISMQDLSFQCENSELPGRDINMIEYQLYGFLQRLPHRNNFGQASFTFIVTGDLWEKRFFDSWLDFMIPSQTGLVNYPQNADGTNNYEADIVCNQYDLQGQLAYSVALQDAIPMNIGQLAQSWDSDAIHRLQVTFAFKKWLPMTVNVDHQNATPLSRVPGAPTGPPGLLSSITNTLSRTFDARAGQLAVAGVGASALGSALKAI